MKNIFSEMQERARKRILDGTQFSDETSEVCTPSCRADAILRRAERSVYRSGLRRY